MKKVMHIVCDWHQIEEDFDWILQKNNYTILYFYPKDNTPGCTVEANEFSALVDEFSKFSVGIVGVSKDWVKSHCKFTTDHGLLFPLVSDTDLVLHEEFSTIWEKKMFWKSYTWTIRSTFVLDNNRQILKERRNVKAKWHAQAVLDYCATL